MFILVRTDLIWPEIVAFYSFVCGPRTHRIRSKLFDVHCQRVCLFFRARINKFIDLLFRRPAVVRHCIIAFVL